MTPTCSTEGSVAYVQGELDNEAWEVMKNRDGYTAVHRKYMSRLSHLGEVPYHRETLPITTAEAKAFGDMSDEMRIIEMRKLFREKRSPK